MYFYRKHKRGKKKKNKGKCIDTSGCMKSKKRFGLTADEMNGLVSHMIGKPKIPIEFIN